MALMLSAVLPACEMPPPTAGNDPATGGDPSQQTDGTDPDAALGAIIHRIDMPLDVPMEACWEHVDESVLPALMNGMWQINGLRIGVLHAEHAEAFGASLPVIHGESRAKLFTSFYPTAVRSTPRLREPVPIDLTTPPRSPTIYRAHGGRMQMLVRIGQSDDGLAFVEITPHHFKPKTDLIPRSPLEKQLDGRVFRELSAMLPITPDTAIVIGLYRPAIAPVIEAASGVESAEDATAIESTETPSEEGQPADQAPIAEEQKAVDTAAEPQLPEIPAGLGRSLMTATRARQDIQLMVVISMLEDESAVEGADNK